MVEHGLEGVRSGEQVEAGEAILMGSLSDSKEDIFFFCFGFGFFCFSCFSVSVEVFNTFTRVALFPHVTSGGRLFRPHWDMEENRDICYMDFQGMIYIMSVCITISDRPIGYYIFLTCR